MDERRRTLEEPMSIKAVSTRSSAVVAALASAVMLAVSVGPAAAFTLSAPSLEPAQAAQSVDKVWYRCGYGRCGGGYYGHPYGWRGGYGVYAPGLVYGRHCWRGYYGHVHCN
jgi:hypothetical protein